MTRTVVLGLATGVVLAGAYSLYANNVGIDSDGALAWNFMYLPLLAGVLAGVWGRLRSTKELHHFTVFALVAAIGYRVIEETAIIRLGEDVMKRPQGSMVAMALATFVLTWLVSGVIFVVGGLATHRIKRPQT